MSNTYAILNAIYDVAMFEHTVKEFLTKGYITWETRLTKVKPDSIVYICYSNLPMESEGRLLFRGVVLESNIKLSLDEIYGNKDMTEVKAIKICNLEAIAYADTEKYCKSRLEDEFGISKSSLRGGIYLKDGCEKKLIQEIESDIHERRPVTEALEFFEQKINSLNEASFCEAGRKHETFIKSNGMKYFEIHHLVPYSATKLGIPEELIESRSNKYQLCSNCHNEIHYAYIDSRRALIKRLYLLRKEWYDNHFHEYAAPMSVLNWLYHIYRVEKAE